MSILLDSLLILTVTHLNVLIGYLILIKRDSWQSLKQYKQETIMPTHLANIWEDN